MKAFMEEYGVILVAALVILILVGAAQGIGQNIVDGIRSVIDKFTDKMDDVVNKIDSTNTGYTQP